jgi:hypothetical protein
VESKVTHGRVLAESPPSRLDAFAGEGIAVPFDPAAVGPLGLVGEHPFRMVVAERLEDFADG